MSNYRSYMRNYQGSDEQRLHRYYEQSLDAIPPTIANINARCEETPITIKQLVVANGMFFIEDEEA